MNGQLSDNVTHRDEGYALIGTNGPPPFVPAEHGMTPVDSCAICRRGFLCYYEVRLRRLLLNVVQVNLDGPAPPLFGAAAGRTTVGFFNALYAGLGRPLPFTGGLLLARKVISGLYERTGLPPAWKFREVRELIFRGGVLEWEADCSARVEHVRRRMGGPRGEVAGNEAEWIERCFSHRYQA